MWVIRVALTVGQPRRADDRRFVTEVRGRQAPAPGERMTLMAAAQDVHGFDATGLRIPTQTAS